MSSFRTIGMLAACGALGLTGTALAEGGQGHGQGHAHAQGQSHAQTAKPRNAVFTATVTSVDTGAGTLTVSVTRGNHWARPYVGKSLVVTTEKLNVGDTNGDGTKDLADVRSADVVKFHAKIATDGQATAISTRRVVDVTRSSDDS